MARRPRKRQEGTGSVRVRKSRRTGAITFQIRYRPAPGLPQVSETYATRELAERALVIHAADRATGKSQRERDPSSVPTIALLSPEWFDERVGPKNRNNDDEQTKFDNHLLPELGRYRPDEVTPAMLQALALKLVKNGRKRRRKGDPEGLARSTVRQLMAILSSFYTWAMLKGHATRNPWQLVPPEHREKFEVDHSDFWRNRPWVKKKGDIHTIYAELPRWAAVAYAIGSQRGCRPGEIRALERSQVDLEARVIHIVRQVRNGRIGPPKGGRSRTIPISESLHRVLAEWFLATGNAGLVIAPRRRRFRRVGTNFISEKAFNQELRKVLRKKSLPVMTWYEATRHTFASHFVRDGGSLEVLAALLGQASTEVTKRYSHLQAHQIRPEDIERAQVDLRVGEVVALRPDGTEGGASEAQVRTQPATDAASERRKTEKR